MPDVARPGGDSDILKLMNRLIYTRCITVAAGLLAVSGVTARAQLLFATQGASSSADRVMSVSTGGSGATTLFSGLPFGNPNDLAVDAAAGKVYIADGTGGQAVRVANLNGSGSVTALYNVGISVSGIALDVQHQQVYFTTQGSNPTDDRVMRVNFDGTGATTLYSGATSFANPNGLALDLAAGKLYVADGTGGQSIKVGNLDGSGSLTTVLDVHINVSGLALDPANQAIYFTTQSATPADDRVMRVSYTGTGATTLYSGAGAFANPNHLALDLSADRKSVV